MKKGIVYRIFITLILFGIAFLYSSEMSFMPNYIHRADKWHLLIPMVLGYFMFLLLTILLLASKKYSKSEMIELWGILGFSLLGFMLLNNPKGNSQVVGYIMILSISLINILLIFTFRQKMKSGRNASANKP